jgi:hypothetical protein
MRNHTTFATLALTGMLGVGAALSTMACHKDDSGSGASASASAAAASANVPTPQDYESKAKTEITTDNLDDQLDSLEKDITTDNRK